MKKRLVGIAVAGGLCMVLPTAALGQGRQQQYLNNLMTTAQMMQPGFAPAVDGDEIAYRALYSALASYDRAFAEQLAAPPAVNE